MVGTKQFLYIITVYKFFFSSIVEHFYICSAIVTGNLFTETTIQNSVFKGNH